MRPVIHSRPQLFHRGAIGECTVYRVPPTTNVFLLNGIGCYLHRVISAVDKTFAEAKIRLASALVFLYEPQTS